MSKNGLYYIICHITLAVIFFTGCHQNTSVPQHLTGEWKTSAPGYRDRCLKFEESFLIFGTGKGREISHYIYKIEAEKNINETIYNFHYKDHEDVKWTLTFVYTPDYGGVIQIKNRDAIWRKADTGGN